MRSCGICMSRCCGTSSRSRRAHGGPPRRARLPRPARRCCRRCRRSPSVGGRCSSVSGRCRTWSGGARRARRCSSSCSRRGQSARRRSSLRCGRICRTRSAIATFTRACTGCVEHCSMSAWCGRRTERMRSTRRASSRPMSMRSNGRWTPPIRRKTPMPAGRSWMRPSRSTRRRSSDQRTASGRSRCGGRWRTDTSRL